LDVSYKLGKNILISLQHARGSYKLFIEALKYLPYLKVYPVRAVLYRQIYFTGIEALKKVTIMGILIGIVIITQVSNIVGFNPVLIGRILVWTVVRELGPLFVAIIVIARSCTAIAAELGSMKVNREIDALNIMGIDPFAYLIMPRILGISASVFMLAFYFQLSAIAGGLIVSSFFTDILIYEQLKGIFSVLSIFQVSVSLIKSAIFGLLISTVSCYHGLRVQSSITEIPQVTTFAVMQSLFIVFIFDGIITVVSFI